LKGVAKGTSIPSISKKQLEEFEIVMMPREIQQKLVTLNKLKKEENDLVSKIERLKKLIFEQDLNTIIQQYE
jgi:restriction endonuclease S subunit